MEGLADLLAADSAPQRRQACQQTKPPVGVAVTLEREQQRRYDSHSEVFKTPNPAWYASSLQALSQMGGALTRQYDEWRTEVSHAVPHPHPDLGCGLFTTTNSDEWRTEVGRSIRER